MPSENGQNGMMSVLWEMWCEEDSDYHQVGGDEASGQGLSNSSLSNLSGGKWKVKFG